MVQTDWSGTWQGTVRTYPEGQIGDGWQKSIVIGPYPTADGTCTTLNSTFTNDGTVQLTKDYRLCRGQSASDLYIDAGSHGKLEVQWMSDVLVSPFKQGGMFVISNLRMRGNFLEEEIIMVNDNPGDGNNLVSIRASSMHQIKMKRIDN